MWQRLIQANPVHILAWVMVGVLATGFILCLIAMFIS